ncbi:uncharacterized protein KY384_000910 [Bacidia gigantensis]|uniref:uncharacterized protein n=1 Tax=Bacidia gigantensis TaxID=2732470 RepID=UPI001D0383C0|nr:uncharacterized protein KY384_000910 [Bacidia gigantensis]KAG8534067.1 hypothetical protein KY384_000910 [Bacidia gigantensis]
MIDETLHPRKEGKKTAMYAVMDKTAPDLAKVSVGAAVGELGVGGVGGVGKGVEGKGVVLEEVVDGGQGVLVENVGLRRLAEADGMGT